MSKVIYEPKGKAAEYAALAVNLYTGCSHGCRYCYAPKVLHRTPEDFHGNVKPRKGILDSIRKEAPAYAGKEVMLCFTCDPYGQEEMEYKITRQAIEIFHAAGVGVNVLTKGGLRLMRDMDLFTANPALSKIGATLTFSGPDGIHVEPYTAMPADRVQMLQLAHAAGIDTWASLEPVIYPEQALTLIEATHPYVDHYKVGKWNYDPRAKDIDWRDFLRRAVALLDSVGASYYIKADLAAYGGRE